jgi:tetraacyldisaccharide-1-P 4'-kinase
MPIFEKYAGYRKGKPIVVTTEKDALKLGFLSEHPQLKNLPMFVLPVEFRLHDEDAVIFQEFVDRYVRTNQNDRSVSAQ